MEAAVIPATAANLYLSVRVSPAAGSAQFGLRLKGREKFRSGYDLCFRPLENRVELFDQAISCVDGLDQPFDLEIILKDDLIDVCIDGRRCLTNRCPELQGDQVYFFARDASVVFETWKCGCSDRRLYPTRAA